MIITVDRIEKDRIILELTDGQMIEVPRALIPGAQEGAIYSIKKENKEQQTRRQRIEEKAKKLFY